MAHDWQERATNSDTLASLIANGFSPVQARLLALRGVTPETVANFLAPDFANLAEPTSLPGVREAVDVLLATIREKKKIVVFGDYDCDGVCATSILVLTLTALGARVEPFLPDRLTEGYGMNDASVDRLLKEHPTSSLVITVDNGINSIEQVAKLKNFGLPVIVTDHHLPGEKLPDCLIVNPKVSAPANLENLCGAGVAFMLAAALVASAKASGDYQGPNLGGPLLVLAGLATVTDIMPLTDQNRILVAEALAHFRAWAPLGLRELFDRASRAAAPVLTSRDFSFLIGPRINAAGRIASGMEAVDLILATDREEARRLARTVDFHNTTRKTIEQKMTEQARAQVEPGASAQVIILSSEDNAHPGIAGIVAARLLERQPSNEAVPVAVIVDGHGSARSPEGFHVRNALQDSSAALVRFGGHAAAGGLTVREGCSEQFRELFRAACAKQIREWSGDSRGVVFADAEIDASVLTLEFAQWIQKLEPFGEGNAQPVFLLRGVKISEVRPLGVDGRHLQIVFRDSVPRAVWWNHGDRVDDLRARAHEPCDILATVEISTYGETHVELRLIDLAH